MKTQQTFYRFGSIANMVGGICVAIAYTLHPHHATPEIIASQFWLSIHSLFALSLLFGVFGLFALFTAHFAKSSITGLTGFVLAVVSLIGIFGLNFFETLINPVLAIKSPAFVQTYGAGTGIGYVAVLFPILGVLFLLGYLLFCADMLSAKTTNQYALGLTMVGTLVFGVGLSGFLPMLVVQVGAILFGSGLLTLGYFSVKTDKAVI